MTQKIPPEYQRAQCIALSNAGFFCREASKFIGIFKSSVRRAIKRFEETAHINRIINDWKRVIFSDEITFYVIKRKNEVKIWRTKDERWKEDCMEVAAVVVGGHVNFSGAITSEGTGCFRIYSENTNSNVYCDILNNYLIPTVHLYQMENDYIYQYDNARYHVSRHVQAKLHELGVELLQWPAKSPDLNVIAHLRSIIDNKLKSRPLSSVKELTEALSIECLSMKPELCNKLVLSMSKKIQKCIANSRKSIDF
ncbi:unnamed protein product [Rotaria sordida]|uniref:Tc1-like transposase DDE domain-containing protein n=1 Tax=Rotaria sordida TaxID=392033 RepID=A0A820CMU8_9BILA|nr:unnamed protein product [Rotaria sordida]